MSKTKKNSKKGNRNLSHTAPETRDPQETIGKFVIGSLIAGGIGSVFMGITVYLYPDIQYPANIFLLPGAAAGAIGALIGSKIHSQRRSPQKGETLYLVLGAAAGALIVNIVALFFIIQNV